MVPGKGMLLNGKKVLLKGYANHHTLGALGAAAYPRAIEKRIKMMKEFGLNHIRSSHNPYSSTFATRMVFSSLMSFMTSGTTSM